MCFLIVNLVATENQVQTLNGKELENTFRELGAKWDAQRTGIFTVQAKFRRSCIIGDNVKKLSSHNVEAIIFEASRKPSAEVLNFLIIQIVDQEVVEKKKNEEGINYYPIMHQQLFWEQGRKREDNVELRSSIIEYNDISIKKDDANHLIYVELPSDFPINFTGLSNFRIIPKMPKAIPSDMLFFIGDSTVEITSNLYKVRIDKETGLLLQSSLGVFSSGPNMNISEQRFQLNPCLVGKNDWFPMTSILCKYQKGVLESVDIYDIDSIEINGNIPDKIFKMSADESHIIIDRRDKANEAARKVNEKIDDVIRFLDYPLEYSSVPVRNTRLPLFIIIVNTLGLVLIVYLLWYFNHKRST
jgi:hypothetical protein